jgi:hypothetical protein
MTDQPSQRPDSQGPGSQGSGSPSSGGQGTGDSPAGYEPPQFVPPGGSDVPAPPTAGQDQPGHGQHAGAYNQPQPPQFGQNQFGQQQYNQPGEQYGAPYAQPPSPYGQPAGAYGQPSSPYGQPAYYGMPAEPKGLSIASMVCGIASVMFGLLLLPQLAAIITGHLALKREPSGKGMSITGLVLGYLCLLFYGAILAFLIVGAAIYSSSYGY